MFDPCTNSGLVGTSLLACEAATHLWKQWQVIPIIVLFIVFFFLTLFYMLSKIFNNSRMERWAKSEFMQLFASAIMVFSFIFLLSISMYIAQQLVGITSPGAISVACPSIAGSSAPTCNALTPIQIVQCMVSCNVYKLSRLYDTTYQHNLAVERYASMCISFVGINVWCGDWSVHGEVEKAHMLGWFIVQLLIGLAAFNALLHYLENTLLPILLSMGVILRIFPFTRGMGGLLIALAIGFGLVFPVLYIIGDPTNLDLSNLNISPIEAGSLSACFNIQHGYTTVITEAAGSVGNAAMAYDDIATTIASIRLLAVLYPFLVFAVTIIFVNSIAPLLGGESGEVLYAVSKIV